MGVEGVGVVRVCGGVGGRRMCSLHVLVVLTVPVFHECVLLLPAGQTHQMP